jgi:hypothetical protein
MIQIHVNSNDAVSSSGLSSYMFELPQTIQYDARTPVYVELTSADIPMSYYVINSTNHTLQIKIGNNNHNIVLDIGNYDADEIASMLNTKFIDAGHAVTVTYSSNTNRMAFTCISETIQIRSGTTCGYLIGFINGRNSNTGHILTSPISVDVQTVEKFIILSSFSTDNMTTRESSLYAGVLASFAPNAPFNGSTSYNGSSYKYLTTIESLKQFTITVVNESFQEIDFNNVPLYFTITLYNR